jgi:hypothetical protein
MIFAAGFVFALCAVGGRADERMDYLMATFIEDQQSKISHPIYKSSPKLPRSKPSDTNRNRLFSQSRVRNLVPRWVIFFALLAGSGLLFRFRNLIKKPSISSEPIPSA